MITSLFYKYYHEGCVLPCFTSVLTISNFEAPVKFSSITEKLINAMQLNEKEGGACYAT